MKFVAIDPGKNGGIAAADVDLVIAFNMPTTPKDIYKELSSIYERGSICYLEDVGHGMPGQSSKATATFARHNGHVEMALLAIGYKVIKVTPAKWQKRLNVLTRKGESKTDHKNRMKEKAQYLFPEVSVTLKTADALLLLEYALEMEQKKQV